MSGSLHPFESCLHLYVCVSGNESYTDSSCLTLLYVGFLANFLLATEVRHDTLKVAGGFAECGWSFGVVFQTFTEMTSLETNKSHEFHYMTFPLHRVVNHWPKNDSAKFHCYGQKRSEHIHVKRRQLQRRAKPRQKNVFDGTPPGPRFPSATSCSFQMARYPIGVERVTSEGSYSAKSVFSFSRMRNAEFVFFGLPGGLLTLSAYYRCP